MALVARASGSNRYGGPELHDVGPSAYPGQMLSPVYAVLSRLPYADPEPSPTSTTEGFLDVVEREPGEKNDSLMDWAVGAPLRILVILVVGTLLLALLRRAIRLVTGRLAEGNVLPDRLRGTPADALSTQRRANRARTLGSVLRSTANIVIGSLVALLVLAELDVNLAPLLASAGVAGVALGFGAQSLVKDFLSGAFMLFEDQYGVGDLVDFGDVVGEVEEVALRVTKVRDFEGALWYLRNGEILRVANRTQGWGRAFVELRVGYDEDPRQVQSLLAQATAKVQSDPELGPLLLNEPFVSGIEDLAQDSMLFRIIVRTPSGDQFEVARELRAAALESLTAAGIPLVGGTRMTVVDKTSSGASTGAAKGGEADDEDASRTVVEADVSGESQL
ncbi:hypothetical protein GCM10011331_02190 [Flavimobilis marinus]|nr:hypothetical protein GCM10011331_02190 [Flavimobilis marinus]